MKAVALMVSLMASTIAYADYYPVMDYKVYGTPASATDKAEIDDLMEGLWTAWSDHDAATFANLHAEDAEWTNAFGRTFRGASELENFLGKRLFPAFDQKIARQEAAAYVPISRRYIGDDAAVVTGRMESNRGSSVGSANRVIGFTFVLGKVDGEWKVTNQVITDLREKRGSW